MAIKQSRGVTIGKGTPQRNEGQNGDITIRSSRRGLKMYVKQANMWHSVDLGIDLRQISNTVQNLERKVKELSTKRNNFPVVDKLMLKQADGATSLQIKNDAGEVAFRNSADSADVTLKNPKMTGSIDGTDNNPVISTDLSNIIQLAFNNNTSDFYVRLIGQGGTYDNALQFYQGANAKFSAGIYMALSQEFGINIGNALNDTGANTLNLTEDILVASSVGIHGPEMITSDYVDNGTFTNDNGNWAVHDPETTSGVSIATHSGTAGQSGGGLTVVTSNTSAEIQGVKLSTSYFDTLTGTKDYIVSVWMKAAHADATGNYYIGLGGAVTPVFSIDTTGAVYTKKITANSDADLLIYNTNTYNGTSFYIDNVSIKEFGVPLTVAPTTADINALDITETGALDSGSISSGFGAIDNGSSNITTTGTVTTGPIAAGSSNITTTGTVASGPSTCTSSTITGATLTSSASFDKLINATQTLNAGMGENVGGLDEVYTMINADLTVTDGAGWDNIYLMNLKVGGTSKFLINRTGGVIADSFTGTTIWECFPFIANNAVAGRPYFRDVDDPEDFRVWDDYDTSPTSIISSRVPGQFIVPENCTLKHMRAVVNNFSYADDIQIHIFHGTPALDSLSGTTLAQAGSTTTISVGTARFTYAGSENYDVDLDVGDVVIPMVEHNSTSGNCNLRGSISLKFVTRS
tara:strand:+ start:1424 stop:3499 length:2076 start_codon:yes stop_codon:yes gene_type:complete